jgi:hypothetical protein
MSNFMTMNTNKPKKKCFLRFLPIILFVFSATFSYVADAADLISNQEFSFSPSQQKPILVFVIPGVGAKGEMQAMILDHLEKAANISTRQG